MTRQLTGREEHGIDKLVGLVEEEPEEEAGHRGTQEVQDNQPPGSHTCAGAQEEQRCHQVRSY